VTPANRCLSVLLAGAIGVGVTVTVARGQAAAAPPSVRAGAYTEEQAIRGQALYASHCSQCHGESLAGLDQAPPLVGPQFNSIWDGAPLLALVGRIDTMPPDKPGSLTRAESVDVLSYMLWFNGLPFGEQPLGTEQSVLAQARFEAPLLSGQ
jgi:mono/diheme cytochrome c family protein